MTTNRRAFTLIELLVVVGIMGLLGTISVGGYRAMRRGMEEKGVMQNVNFFLRAAYQRAQIDRQPTAVFLWNETLRAATADDNEIVVGKAVAVRRAGRISGTTGQLLIDEFADLDKSYPTDKEASSGSQNNENTLFIYQMDRPDQLEQTSRLPRSTIERRVYEQSSMPNYAFGEDNKKSPDGETRIVSYAFKLIDKNGVSWLPGMAYGFEFANLTLPRGYIFGSSFSKSDNDPIEEAGTIVFYVGRINENGKVEDQKSSRSIQIYCLRPGKDGSLSAQQVGKSEDPSKQL